MKKIAHGFGKIGSGTTPSSGNSDYYSDGNINWLQTGDLTDGDIFETSKKITSKAVEDFSALKFFKPGSIVMAMYGATIGKMGVLKIETTTNQACCVMAEPKSFTPEYAFYWFVANRDHIISLSYGGGQPNISQAIISAIRMHCPPIVEQTTIANYLDKKTAQIDELIKGKQKLIELLKEERTAIINQSVTKGINPKVKLKPSGIEWLGDIPAHWEVKKLKYVADKVLTGSTPPTNEDSYYDDDIDWYTPADFSDNLLLQNTKKKIAQVAIDDDVAKLFPANSVLLVSIGATLGKVGYIIKPASSNQQINAFTFKSRGAAQFYANFFYVKKMNIVSLANSATLPILNQAQAKDIVLPVPPHEEVEVIIKFITTNTGQIDTTISTIEKEIELMLEYRTALISEVVTGKIKID
jgi:type I restriction enzyme S subunit